ncbi:glycoside hydrolase family 3 protein [Nocardioides sp. YIM B13467]|uniref:glycoside hydrolase family 3 protein n=1 Tax=Nocardioides sp. YIM B13467 TaxID=3366294 RepID=UPI00366F9021
MDGYRDPALPVEHRVEDLLRRMTIAEKAAMMVHPSTSPAAEGLTEADALASASHHAGTMGITHFNVLGGEDSSAVAAWHNTLQEIAESTRLGIPITLSTDPRHGFRSNLFTGQSMDSLSRWPDYPGIAASGGLGVVRAFGDTMRQELLAMGVRVLLGPMADIFSEPRWSRGSGTFGEDPERVAELTVAFIEALRGGRMLGPDSVAAVVKHFPGGGPQLKGDDAHDPRFPEQVYPGEMRGLHLRPFERAFAGGATQVMTYYGKPVGTEWPEVGFAFNEPVVRDLLRRELGFDGIVVTDWNVLEPESIGGLRFGPNGWGLEHLTPVERAAIAIDVGVDQFGGERNPALIEELVETGRIAESRIDESVRRLLKEKFRLGVFESRRVNVEQARAVCGSAEFAARAVRGQEQSLVLASDNAPLLPLDARVMLEGVERQAAIAAGLTPVSGLSEADAVVVRLDAPFTPGRGSLGDYFRGGTLAFDSETLARLSAYAAEAPLFVSVYLERPAILGPLLEVAAVVVGDFGASDAVVLSALQGRTALTGTFPFDIPSSMAAVEASREDVPFDTVDPLFRAGYGLKRAAFARTASPSM